MKIIYAKTAKGQQEIEHRGSSLTPRVRRLLILLDGKRPAREVASLVADSQFEETLGFLVSEGYAEPVTTRRKSDLPEPAAPAAPVEAQAAEPAVSPVVPEAPAAAESPPAPVAEEPADPRRVEMARNVMLNSLHMHYGPFEQLTLKTRIQQSRDLQELRSLKDDWYLSITQTRAGRKHADEMKQRLMSVL